MKFDLFDAMAIIKKEFGDSGELLLRTAEYGYAIRISVFHNGEFHHKQELINYHEITDSKVHVMNFKFNKAIKELKIYLSSPPTEQEKSE